MAAVQLQPPPYEAFDCRSEGKNVRWTKWLRRLENNVFSGCGINNAAQKKGLLLMYAGSDLNDIVDSFDQAILQPIAAVAAANEQPAVDAQNVYQRLTAALTAHFNPRANVEFQRYLFKRSMQETPEIDDFYCNLKQLSETCQFAEPDAEIKSQIIMGCKLDKVRDKGLSDPDVTLERLLQFGRNLQITQEHSKAIKEQGVNAVYSRPRSAPSSAKPSAKKPMPKPKASYTTPPRGAPSSSKTCRNCGGEWHRGGLRRCPAWGKSCKICHKENHFASVCLSSQEVHHVQEEEEEPEYAYRIHENTKTSSPLFDINVNNSLVTMMADSGASVNILSEAHYRSMKKQPDLQPSRVKIYAYGETTAMNTLGEIKAHLTHNNNTCDATLIVVESGKSSLLSWKTSLQLNLIKLVNNVTSGNVERLVGEYSDLFTGLGKLKDCQVRLHIDETVQPVAQKHRRVPFHVRKDLEDQLRADEELGVIQSPSGPTPWVSPVVCVPKKNGKLRVCVDMRCANTAIKRERHATPTVNELVNDLNGAKVFSKLDLNQGYNQLELEPESRYITTFATHVGLKQFTRLSFGVCSAAEIFQEAIRNALAGLDGTLNLSDDILVFGVDQKTHDNNLRAVFHRLREKGLTLSRKKCEFNKQSLQFYGHIFSEAGLAADPAKISALLEMKPPTSVSEMRSLLGMTNYCGARFVRDYATLTHDLRELVKNEVKWQWSENHQRAFDTLKKALASTPVLQYFNPALQTELHVDASPVGLCGILMQVEDGDGPRRTVQYASRALTPVEQRYSQTEREALAVVWACEHLHIYIMGHPVTIYTDHKPLVPLYNNPRSKPPARIERWTLRLQPYEATLKYRSGKDNPADYLSRHAPTVTEQSRREERVTEEYINYIANNATPKAMTLKELQDGTEQDATLQAVIQAMRSNKWENQTPGVNNTAFKHLKRLRDELSVTESGKVVLRGSRIVVPGKLQQRSIDLAHVGHQGIVKTKALLREKVWFSGIDDQVERMIRNCMACQVVTTTNNREPLQMSPLPERPWSELSTDFGQVPGMNTHFMVISDDYSRYVIVEQVPSLHAKSVIPILDKVLGEFGVPDVIKSDNGPPFNSSSFADYANYKGFKHRKITPLWPRANGEAERFMKTVKKSIKAAIVEGKSWNQELHSFLLNYRATPHSSTGVPPATLMFGRDMKTALPQIVYDKARASPQQADQAAKAKMKTYADGRSHARKSDLQVGEPVLVKNEGLAKAKPPFDPRPLIVTERKGSMMTAERHGKTVTRNSSFFKRSPAGPEEIRSSDEEDEDDEQLNQDPVPQAPVPQAVPRMGMDRPARNRRVPARFDDFVMKTIVLK